MGGEKEIENFPLRIFIFFLKGSNYSAPPMGMSNRLTVVLQQELH